MKEKKGFTLVELLAVLTLLSLVGLISVPIVANVVEKSKVKAFKQTLNGIIDAAKIHNAEANYKLFNNGDIDLTEGIIQFENLDLIVSGYISYNNNEYFLEEVTNSDFCANGILGYYDIYKGSCDTGEVLDNSYSTK